MLSNTIYHRVRYSQVDRMGYLYHVNHYEFIEWGRTEWIRRYWKPYRQIEEEGLAIVVLSVSLKYHRPTHYDDELAIETRFGEWSRSRFIFDYTIKTVHNAQVICSGQTSHCFINKTGHPTRIPQEFVDILNKQ